MKVWLLVYLLVITVEITEGVQSAGWTDIFSVSAILCSSFMNYPLRKLIKRTVTFLTNIFISGWGVKVNISQSPDTELVMSWPWNYSSLWGYFVFFIIADSGPFEVSMWKLLAYKDYSFLRATYISFSKFSVCTKNWSSAIS